MIILVMHKLSRTNTNLKFQRLFHFESLIISAIRFMHLEVFLRIFFITIFRWFVLQVQFYCVLLFLERSLFIAL